MTEPSVIHSTYVIERSYPATPQHVFAAFSDPAKKRRWFAEGESSTLEEFEMDFRVGGNERVCFRLKNGMLCRNDTIYQDILSDRRIVTAYTMSVDDRRISSSQATTEFLPTEKGTDLIFTEQAAFFEGADGPQIRQEGWRLLFDQLAKEMSSAHA
jgi:uncharacterized protein YndB with AHSA1/START domain